MAETPSKRRRKGREAFAPDCDPMDIQPYKKGSWSCEYYLQDWLDGWKEAEEAHKEKIELIGIEYERLIPCKWCGIKTDNLGTEACDRCWEVKYQIEMNLEVAKKIMEAINGKTTD